MIFQKINRITLCIILGMILSFNSIIANAEDDFTISLGVKLLASKWQGENNTSGTEYDQNEGGQIGWNIGLQTGRFYTGLSLQGGEYDFNESGPDQVSPGSTVAVTNVKVERAELDLIAGYYFWDNISLFVDLKSISNDHNKNNYEQSFSGIGLGIAGAWPISHEVSIYGSFGFVTNSKVQANDKDIGNVDSVAFEVGAVFKIAESHRLTAGLKVQGQEYKFDNGNTQTHDVSGFFVGYNYLFSLN